MTLTDQPAAAEASGEAYPRPRYAWYVVGVLMVVYMFSFVDRQILNLLVRPMRRDLEISDTQMSLLMGFSFALFYALFGMPLGRLADLKSRRAIIAGGLLAWSLLTAACGLARNFAQLFALRMGVGVGEASLAPAAYSLIVDYFPAHRRATALGVYSMGIYIGSGLAFILGGTVAGLAAVEGTTVLPLVGEVRPWQMVFFMVGLPGILATLLMLSVREPLRRGHGASGTGAAVKVPLAEVFHYLGRNGRTLVCHNVGFALLSFASYAGGAWIPTFFVRRHGWTEQQAGQIYGLIVAIFGTLGVLFGGWFTDWLSKRGRTDAAMRVGLYTSIVWAPAGLWYLLVPEAWMAVLLLVPTVFFAAAPFSGAAASVQQIMPATMRGQASSIYVLVVTFIGLGIGPSAVALVTDRVFHNDNMVNYSLLIVTVVAHIFSAILLGLGLRPFRESVKRLSEWKAT